jgi:branched-subunit amino acid ABC-type transport system permease component
MASTVVVDYRTAPPQYRHWQLSFAGPVATLAMAGLGMLIARYLVMPLRSAPRPLVSVGGHLVSREVAEEWARPVDARAEWERGRAEIEREWPESHLLLQVLARLDGALADELVQVLDRAEELEGHLAVPVRVRAALDDRLAVEHRHHAVAVVELPDLVDLRARGVGLVRRPPLRA